MTNLDPTTRQNLTTLIQHHTPFDKTEAHHQQAILDLIATAENPLNRDRYTPGHITASAWVIATDTAEIGLIFHRAAQCWLQPGGHVDPNETDILTVALREVQEEMGLKLDPCRAHLFDLDVHPIPPVPPYPAHQHFDIRYLCLTEKQPIAAASDVEQARWFSLAELTPDILKGDMQRMLDKCIQAGILPLTDL